MSFSWMKVNLRYKYLKLILIMLKNECLWGFGNIRFIYVFIKVCFYVFFLIMI